MFSVPSQPKIKLKAKPPDQRKIAVLPLRALRDKTLYNQAIRVLGLLCSYANRAGITWVSGQTLANELGVSRSAISQQMKQLKDKGYVEVIKRGYMGQRTDTVRIIYDPTISAKDALAILGNHDELKSPLMLKEELEAMNKPIQNKVIKKQRNITKSNNVKPAISNNMTEAIREIYLRVLKKEKEIKEKDRQAIEMIEQSGVSADEILAQVEVILKMVASEGLRIPDDIYDISNKLLNAYR